MNIKLISKDGTTLKTANKYCTEDINITFDSNLLDVTTEEKTFTPTSSIQTYTPTSGTYVSKVIVNAVPTETKTVTPSASSQNVTPTSGKFLSSVTVNPIPSNYIIPSGTKTITENGSGIDVSTYQYVNVKVDSSDPGDPGGSGDGYYLLRFTPNVDAPSMSTECTITLYTPIEGVTPSGTSIHSLTLSYSGTTQMRTVASGYGVCFSVVSDSGDGFYITASRGQLYSLGRTFSSEYIFYWLPTSVATSVEFTVAVM